MKEITKYWKQTCIDFGKFVTAKEDWTASTEYMTELWNQFQEQQAEDINDILDEIAPNDKLKEAAIKHNEMIRQKLEEAEEEGFDDDLEFGSKQIIINHDMFKIVEQLQSQVKALHTIVSANGIALNNVEKDLYEDEKFLFNEKSYEESNKETLPEIKCYCGHTT